MRRVLDDSRDVEIGECLHALPQTRSTHKAVRRANEQRSTRPRGSPRASTSRRDGPRPTPGAAKRCTRTIAPWERRPSADASRSDDCRGGVVGQCLHALPQTRCTCKEVRRSGDAGAAARTCLSRQHLSPRPERRSAALAARGPGPSRARAALAAGRCDPRPGRSFRSHPDRRRTADESTPGAEAAEERGPVRRGRGSAQNLRAPAPRCPCRARVIQGQP